MLLAPKISSLVAVVVAEPLLALLPLPVAAAVTSKGLTVSKPAYSNIRMSGLSAAWSKVTVMALLPDTMSLAK
jgi:hypothetical protein